MFSRLTADRFEDRQKENSIGPGSYDLPVTNDDRAPSLAVPGDRFNENGSATPGPGFYTKDGQEAAEPVVIQQVSTRSRMSTSSSKENRPPSARGKTGACPLTREIEQLKRQLNQAEKEKEKDQGKLQRSLDSTQGQLRDARERAERAEAGARAKGEDFKKVEVKIGASEEQVRKCNDRSTKQESQISELASKAEDSRKAAEHVERVASERSDHIKRLQLEAGARSEDVTRLETTVARLEKDSGTKEVELSGVREQLVEAVRQREQAVADLQLTLDDVQTQLSKSKQRADDAEVLAATKADDLARAETAVAALEEQAIRSREKHQEQEARIADLTVKSESDSHKILANEAAAARVEEELGAKDFELAKVSARLEEVLRQGEQTVADLQLSLDDMRTQLSDSKQQAENAETDAATKAEDLARAETVVASLDEQVSRSRAKHAEQDSRITEQDSRIIDLTAKEESDLRKICALEATIARLEKDLGAKEFELAKFRAQLEEAVQQGKDTTADLQLTLDDVQTQLSESVQRADNALADVATKAEDLARAERAVGALEEQASRYCEENQKQESCIADLTQKICATEARAARLEEDLGTKEHELARVSEQLQKISQQREQTAGDLQSSLDNVQNQLDDSKKQTDLAGATAVLKAEELARAETAVAALEEQARRSRERLQEQESCIADLTAKSEADSRKIRASEAAIEDGRANFDEAMRKMSEQFTELQEKLGEFQSAREKQEQHALDKAREAREAEERMRHLDSSRRRLKEREVHQAASAVINGILFRVMSAEARREQEAQSHEIARLADAECVLSRSLNNCDIRQAASIVVNTTIVSALSAEARCEFEMQRAETERFSGSCLQYDEQLQGALSQVAGLMQKLADAETRLTLEGQQHDLEQSQFKAELAESCAFVVQQRETFELCDGASRETQSLELQSFSRLVVHQALLKASHALGAQDQHEGSKTLGRLAHVSNELKIQHEAIAQHVEAQGVLQNTIQERDVQLAQMQEEKQRRTAESVESNSRTTELRSEIDCLRAETVRLANVESSLTNSLKESKIHQAATTIVSKVLLHTWSLEALSDLEAQHAEAERFSDSCLQYDEQLQDALSQVARLTQKLADAETHLALEGQHRDLEQSQFKAELAESRASVVQQSEALELCDGASRETLSLELQSFSRLVVHQALLKASHVLGEQDQQEDTKTQKRLAHVSNEMRIQHAAVAQHVETQGVLQNTIQERDVQLAQMQEEKQHAEQALEEAWHSDQQCQLDAEQRIRSASMESESRATELWSEIDRLRGDAAKCDALEKQVSKLAGAKLAAESAVRESQRNLDRCQQKVEHLEAQESRMHRQGEELEGLRRENEEQQEQTRQISASLQQFQSKNEALKRDNRSLEEKVTCMEEDLERVSDQHAKLMGHTNQKQKIRYTLRLKEESIALRQELHKAQQRAAQVEENASRGCGSSLFDVFLVQAGAQSSKRMEPQLVRTPGRQQPAATPVTRTPRQTTPISRTPRAAGSSMRLSRAATGKEQDVEEARQRCELQERALERIRADFQHVLTLVERAADAEDGSVGGCGLAGLLEQLRKHPCVSAQPVSSEPPRTPQTRRSLDGGVSPFSDSAADDFADGQCFTGEEGRQD